MITGMGTPGVNFASFHVSDIRSVKILPMCILIIQPDATKKFVIIDDDIDNVNYHDIINLKINETNDTIKFKVIISINTTFINIIIFRNIFWITKFEGEGEGDFATKRELTISKFCRDLQC
jgi:hypothetical protein